MSITKKGIYGENRSNEDRIDLVAGQSVREL